MRQVFLVVACVMFAGCAAPVEDNEDPGVSQHVLDCDYTLDGVALDCESAITQNSLSDTIPDGWRCVSREFTGSYATYWHEDGRVGILFTPNPNGEFTTARFWGHFALETSGGTALSEAWFITEGPTFFVPFEHVAEAGDGGIIDLALHPMLDVRGEVPEARLDAIEVLGVPAGDNVAPILRVPSDPPRHYLPGIVPLGDGPTLGWTNMEIMRGDILEFAFDGGNHIGEASWQVPQDIAVQEFLGNDPCADA